MINEEWDEELYDIMLKAYMSKNKELTMAILNLGKAHTFMSKGMSMLNEMGSNDMKTIKLARAIDEYSKCLWDYMDEHINDKLPIKKKDE